MKIWLIILISIIIGICYGVRPIFDKIVLQKLDPIEILSIQAISVFAIIGIFVLCYKRTDKKLKSFSISDIIFLIFGISAGVIGFILWGKLLQKESPFWVMMITGSLSALITAILTYFIFKIKINFYEIIGGIIIIVGIIIMSISGFKAKKSAPSSVKTLHKPI